MLEYFDNGFTYFIIIICSVIFVGYVYQGKLIYMNYQPAGSNTGYAILPTYYGMKFEDVWMTTSDGVKINGWLIFEGEKPNSDSPTLIFFHGNAGNMGFRMDLIKIFIKSLHCNVFIVSYRGYGLSKGEPNERGLKLDAKAAFKHIKGRKDLNQNKIYLYGRSLGGAVAISLASEVDGYAGVILENTFISIVEMIDSVIPFLKYVKFLCSEKWLSINKIKKMKTTNLLFISGGKDEIVPPYHMKDLYNACPSKTKKFVYFDNGKHNETWKQAGYAMAIDNFLKKGNLIKEKKIETNVRTENEKEIELEKKE